MNDPMGEAPQIVRAPIKRKPHKKNRRLTTAKPQPRQQQAEAAPELRRANPRPVPPRAEPARDVARENPRGGSVAIGRDGERLTRLRVATGDPLDVPANEIPAGWSYQWNTVTVLNKGIEEIIRGDLQMHRNGWRPVPASRHPGRWTPPGYEGDIVVDGARLEERPMSLTEDAKAEDTAHARALVRDRTDALRMTQKSLPGAGEARKRGHGGGLKIDFSDKGEDIPRPKHEVEHEEEF